MTLDEQIKLNYIKENNDFVHAKTMRQKVILVSKALFDDDSRINYSTIAKIFKSNVNSVKRHINSSINSNKNGRPSIFPEGTKEKPNQLQNVVKSSKYHCFYGSRNETNIDKQYASLHNLFIISKKAS